MSNKPKPPTHNGRPHWKCGTTLKYSVSGNCVYCHAERMRLSARGQVITDELLDKLDEKLLDFPRRPVTVNRKCGPPLLLEIPAPPLTAINRPWQALTG